MMHMDSYLYFEIASFALNLLILPVLRTVWLVEGRISRLEGELCSIYRIIEMRKMERGG